jgi:outer membrane murein-binding lipoprotein Lpp
VKTVLISVLVGVLFLAGGYWVGGEKGREAETKLTELNQKTIELSNTIATQAEQIKELESSKEALSNSSIDEFAQVRRDRDSKWLAKDAEFAVLGVVDSDSFLESVRIDDMFTEIRLAKKFTEIPATLQGMNGVYGGKLKVDNHPTLTLEINLSVNDALWDDQLKGKLIIRLLENGKEFVSSGNEGKLEAISQFSGSAGALLIHARPTHYFQVYPLSSSRVLIGNYYKQLDKAGSYQFLGSFELARK